MEFLSAWSASSLIGARGDAAVLILALRSRPAAGAGAQYRCGRRQQHVGLRRRRAKRLSGGIAGAAAQKGHSANVTNAGVNGDVTAGMLRRIDSAVPKGTDIVILQPGGNDLRFFGTKTARTANIAAMAAPARPRHPRHRL